ncbi:MAG: SsrA-binding protein SmpB [Coriobacteriia bacterium]|nr:SsrA-binding protein SmpB [Coriobacteriia bacterium]
MSKNKNSKGAASKAGSKTKAPKTIARNRRASFDYERIETFEAGIELTGTEVRSLREGGGQLTDTFAIIRAGEVWLLGLHIKPYSHGNRANQDPDRRRRLLLHKKQIRYLSEKVTQAGLTLVPFSIYFSVNNLVKVELVLARGKKTHDKRSSMIARDSKREIDRALKDRSLRD